MKDRSVVKKSSLTLLTFKSFYNALRCHQGIKPNSTSKNHWNCKPLCHVHSSPQNPKHAFCLPGFRRSLLHLDTSVYPLQKVRRKKSFSETSETICSFDALWVFPSLMRLRHGSSVFDDKLLDKRHIWPLVRYVNVIRPSITLSYTYSCMPRWLLFFFFSRDDLGWWEYWCWK